MSYLKEKAEGTTLTDIAEHSGANAMRVYPILMELYINDELDVLEQTDLGGFVRVRLKRR